SSYRRHPGTTPFPYTTLFRSEEEGVEQLRRVGMGRVLENAAMADGDRRALGRVDDLDGNAGLLEHEHVVFVAVGLDRALALGKRSEEHTSELQSRENLVCRLL